ncbi:MAG: response regulator [Pseudomonadota bacterium]
MKSKILIVDDNQEMLLSLKEALEKYKEIFTVSIAGDGIVAMEKLKRESFSLVLTDLKMPRMDGLSLLSHIIDNYPHIPVLVMTGFSTVEREKLATQGGCIGYLEKPLNLSELAEKIHSALKWQSDSGVLHNITTTMFAQLIQMEQKTCTVRLIDSHSGKEGALFFSDGQLLDAITPGKKGLKAAHDIFSWGQVTLAIQNSCVLKENRIKEPMQSILLEAMRQKDEKEESRISRESSVKPVTKTKKPAEQPAVPNRLDRLKQIIKKEIGKVSGYEDFFIANAWNNFVSKIARIGDIFECGSPRVIYISKGDPKDLILIPNDDIIAISVNSRCPRDSIIQMINDKL